MDALIYQFTLANFVYCFLISDPASLYDYINPTDDGYLNPQPGG